MVEPIFRYIVVLVAVIVIIRILLGISASKMQENKSQPGETTLESSGVVEPAETLNTEQEIFTDSQIPDQQDEKTDNE